VEGVCKNTGKEGESFMEDGELGKVYSDGEIIFDEGDKGDVMYVIQSGKVRISIKSASGDIPISTLQSGDIFGEMALFEKLPRSATALAEGDTRILSVDKKKLFSTISKDPTVVLKILEVLSGKLRWLSNEFTALKKKKLDILGGSMDPEETCNLILEEVRNNIAVENGSVMLLEGKKDQLYIKAAFGDEAQEKMDLAIGEGVAGNVIRTGKAELINNVSLDSQYKPGALEISSLICVPLKYQDACFGVLNFSSRSENQFTQDNLKLLHSFSRYASLALRNALNISALKDATDEVLKHPSMLGMY
jgi:CRP-like cAMP-binding protein